MLSRVNDVRLLPRDNDVRARLDQPQLWVPQFKVFVDIADQDENALAREWLVRRRAWLRSLQWT